MTLDGIPPAESFQVEGGRLNGPCKLLKKMARPTGFEPVTYGLEVRCSILAELRAHQGFQGIHHNAVCGSV